MRTKVLWLDSCSEFTATGMGWGYFFFIEIELSRQRAAVWCSPDGYRFRCAGIWVWDDGQAGPCMGAVHGCMAKCLGAWHFGEKYPKSMSCSSHPIMTSQAQVPKTIKASPQYKHHAMHPYTDPCTVRLACHKNAPIDPT